MRMQISSIRLQEDLHKLGYPPEQGEDSQGRMRPNKFENIEIARMRYVKYCVQRGLIDEGMGPMVPVAPAAPAESSAVSAQVDNKEPVHVQQ
jgi:hypothetical protein